MHYIIKELRSIAGITQAQAADALDLSISEYRGIESGRAAPDPQQMQSIADLYGMPVGIAFGCYQDELTDERTMQLISAYCNLNAAGRQMLIDYAMMLSLKHSYHKNYIRLGNILQIKQ